MFANPQVYLVLRPSIPSALRGWGGPSAGAVGTPGTNRTEGQHVVEIGASAQVGSFRANMRGNIAAGTIALIVVVLVAWYLWTRDHQL